MCKIGVPLAFCQRSNIIKGTCRHGLWYLQQKHMDYFQHRFFGEQLSISSVAGTLLILVTVYLRGKDDQ